MAQATKSNKKSSTKKTTSKKKKNTKKNSQISFTDILRRREVSATLAFVAGILLLTVALFSGGTDSVWNSFHILYFTVFGICGYYIPLAVLFFSVVIMLNKQQNKYFNKGIELLILLVLISSVLFVSNSASEDFGFSESVGEVFNDFTLYGEVTFSNGGILGAVFGGIIFQICKSVTVSNIILGLFIIADIMFLFGISLLKVFLKIEKPVKKVGEATEKVIEKSRNDISDRIKNYEQSGRNSRKKDVNPSQLVNDFFNSNDNEEEQKMHSTDEKATKTVSEPDLFSFASVIKTPEVSENSINSDEELSDFSADEKANQFQNIFTDADIKPQKNEKKTEPLSDSEQKKLSDSLDEGLSAEMSVHYTLPPLDCLNMPKKNTQGYNEAELKSNGEKLIAALNSFNVNASIVGVIPGPSVTRYELSPAPGVKISKFVGLSDDLALHMAAPAGLRIEAPIPNKAAIGIEIPNRNKTTVTFRETIDNEKFRNADSKLTVALGKDIAGTPMFSNLSKMPHLLVAGTTGSGKSVCLNSMIVSLLYNATPDEVKLLLIDPKQVEFGIYNGLPHLLVPVVSDPRKAAGALGWAVTEMLSRYKTLNANGVRDIAAYNSLCDERDDIQKLPHIVIFIDELADLMTVAPSEVEDSIQRLAQMARAAGMHLVVATQRPSVDVITGVIKSNIPSRIALTVKSFVDSKIIIDTGGAEKLMGNGDMLYYPVGVPKPVRIQGCYLSDAEIENVVDFIKANSTSNYDDAVQQEIDRQAVAEKKKNSEDAGNSGLDSNDELLMRAIELFVGTPEKASISALQRHLGLGFAKAGRLMDTLEQKGIVGPHMGSKPRNVLITKAQWYEMNASSQTSGIADSTDTENSESDITQENDGE